MAKYWTCPYCEAHLDHGERCSCREGKRGRRRRRPFREGFAGCLWRNPGRAAGRIDEK